MSLLVIHHRPKGFCNDSWVFTLESRPKQFNFRNSLVYLVVASRLHWYAEFPVFPAVENHNRWRMHQKSCTTVATCCFSYGDDSGNKNKPLILRSERDAALIIYRTFFSLGTPNGQLSSCSWFTAVASAQAQYLTNGKLPEYYLYISPGNSHCIVNYRPISLLSTSSKVLEHLIFNHMVQCILRELWTFFQDEHHGFRCKMSTATQLVHTIHKLSATIHAGSQIDVIFLDFAKAFDCISYQKLLHNLRCIITTENILCWLNSYLTNRRQYVSWWCFLICLIGCAPRIGSWATLDFNMYQLLENR